MKFKIAILCMLAFIPGINAQTDTLVSKKGTPILPQKGDFAVGFDAMPYLSFFGNMFNHTENNSLNLSDQDIYLRYYISDKSAIRFNVSLYNNTSFTRKYVQDDAQVATSPLNPDALVEDQQKLIQNGYAVMAGYQWFRGYGRLRGFYGAQAGYSYFSATADYEYGNAMTSLNPTPSTYFWDAPERGYRLTESNYGTTQTVFCGGFIGVEYYFAPKMCIGGECRVSYAHAFSGRQYEKAEQWSGNNAEVISTELAAGSSNYTIESSGFGAATTGGLTANGQIYLMFHF